MGSRVETVGPAGEGLAAAGAGKGARGGRGPRGRPGRARVVWPPQQRESAKEAIEQLMRDRGLARRFEQGVERAARAARERPRIAVGGRGAT